MPVPVTIPRLGWSMDEGTFVGWLKQDGDAVKAGEPLFELEGEKSLQQVESIDAGILRIAPECPAAGAVVPVGTLLGYLLAPGEAADAPATRVAPTAGVLQAAAPPASGGPKSAPSAAPAVASPVVAASRRAAVTPRARRAARQSGVDLATVVGSGRGGRVREQDVLAAASNSLATGGGTRPATAVGRLVPHTPHRKTIAQRMLAGGNVAAPVTLTCRVDATNLVNLRKQLQAGSTDRAPGYNDILVKLAGTALQRHPRVNSSWTDDGLLLNKSVHIGIAVDTEAGLVVPVVRDVPNLGLRDVAARARELIELARQRRLTAADQAEGTFTITNLGMFGIEAFTPIVNLPQAAILGVGRIAAEPVVRGGQIVPGDVLTLSLTIDHRVLDGAEAARFLAELAKGIENPAAWLVG